MLLDARGHLKLTDLGLCKKVGDVTPHEEPDAILEMLRRQTISGNGNEPPIVDSEEGADGGVQHASDGFMTIDDSSGSPTKRDEKTRREVRVSYIVGWLEPVRLCAYLFLSFFRWHTLQ
jgi:hypothetical protein